MKQWMLAGSTAAMAMLAANTALADVTAEEVWQNWQDFNASAGGTLTTASAARDGDTLVVKDLKTTSDTSGAKSESAIAELRLRDLGDGTVEITMSEEMSFTSSTAGTDGAPADGASGTVKMPGLVTIASGTADETVYDTTIPSFELAMEPTTDGKPVGKIGITLTDAAMSYLLAGPADAKKMDGEFSSASAAINMDIAEDASTFKGAINAADVAGKMVGNFVGTDMADMAAALAAGFALDSSFSYGAVNYDFDITDESGPAKLVGGSEGGAFQMTMDAAKIMMGGSGKNASISISGAQIPVPEVKLSYAETAFNFLMPVGKSDEPADFALLTKIVDLSVSEDIWGMIDPTGQIPHDPATLIVDAKGKAKVTTDLMDEAAMAALGGMPPGELQSLDVTEIRAKIAGAELTGTGAFTFDNTDLATFGGMPVPTGKLDLKLVGGNTLIDKLVAMGVVTEDDAMGARMMISMFANPGAGADELTSTLEFKDKHFFANGQQLQ
jgi:Uncharacterized protein conserved in bacteria (DUF2125)